MPAAQIAKIVNPELAVFCKKLLNFYRKEPISMLETSRMPVHLFLSGAQFDIEAGTGKNNGNWRGCIH